MWRLSAGRVTFLFILVFLLLSGLASAQGFTMLATPGSAQVCSPNDAAYTLDINPIPPFSDPVTLSSVGEPAGSTASFSVNPVFPAGSSLLTISNTGAAAPGEYMISITGVSPTSTEMTTVDLALFNAVPGPATLASPSDGASDIPLLPSLIWNPATQGGSYAVELSENPGFVPLVLSDTSSIPGLNLAAPLQPNTTYYWRVQPSNACGTQAFTAPFSFTTGTAAGNPPANGFGIQVTPGSLEICTPNDAQYTVGIAPFSGNTDPVTLNASGHPAGSTVSFGVNPVIPPGASLLTVSNTGAAMPGNYLISITGVAPTSTQMSSVSLALFGAPPGTATLTSPADGATGLPLLPNLMWTAAAQASSYQVELADNPGFAPLVLGTTATNPNLSLTVPLQPNTTYYWRVQPGNACGTQSFSAPFSFTTGAGANRVPTVPLLSTTGLAVLLLILVSCGLYLLR